MATEDIDISTQFVGVKSLMLMAYDMRKWSAQVFITNVPGMEPRDMTAFGVT